MLIHPTLKIAPLLLIATRSSLARAVSTVVMEIRAQLGFDEVSSTNEDVFNSFIPALISRFGEKNKLFFASSANKPLAPAS